MALQNNSDTKQNCTDDKLKKEIESSSGDILKKLLTYPLKSASVKEENKNNPSSSNKLEEEPYFDEENLEAYKRVN